MENILSKAYSFSYSLPLVVEIHIVLFTNKFNPSSAQIVDMLHPCTTTFIMSVYVFPPLYLYDFYQFMNILGFYRHFLLKGINTTASIMPVCRGLILIVGKVCLFAWFTGAQLSLALQFKADGRNSMNHLHVNWSSDSCACVEPCIWDLEFSPEPLFISINIKGKPGKVKW